MASPTIPDRFKDAVDILGNQKVLKLVTQTGAPGDARATRGTTASIHYTGTLLDGTKFDSSRDRGQPFETEVGVGRVIKGWDAVMPTMAKNERAEVLIQSDFAYGEMGSPPTIPANAPLIFDMEMLDWFGEDISVEKNKALTKIILKRGNKSKLPQLDENNQVPDNVDQVLDNDDDEDPEANPQDNPQDCSKVTINLTRTNEATGDKIEKSNLEYVLGEEELHPEFLSDGVRYAIKSMRANEKAEFSMKKNSVYNSTKDNLSYTIELLNFEQKKAIWEMNSDEILSSCKDVKARATDLFKQGHLNTALNKYKWIAQNLETFPHEMEGEEVTEEIKTDFNSWNEMKIAVLNNIALIHFKNNDCQKAIIAADQVLEEDSKNEKAMYRKGQALNKMGDTDEAIACFKAVLDINPTNKTARNDMIKSKKLKKELLEKEKKKYAKMFA